MIRSIINFLNEPYPNQHDDVSIVKTAFWAAIIIVFVLFIVSPTQIQNNVEGFKISILFGIATFLVTLVYNLILKYLFKLKTDTPNFTFYKWLLVTMGLVLSIAIVNYIFIIRYFNADSSLSFFLEIATTTFAIAIIPTFIFGSLNLIKNLKANQKIASEITIKDSNNTDKVLQQFAANIDIPIKNSKHVVSINPANVLFVEAMQNYVCIYYTEDGDTKKETIRNTLSNISQHLDLPFIRKCHRSFLVNTNKIESIDGNAQGLKLYINGIDNQIIPVSRKYIPDFRKN